MPKTCSGVPGPALSRLLEQDHGSIVGTASDGHGDQEARAGHARPGRRIYFPCRRAIAPKPSATAGKLGGFRPVFVDFLCLFVVDTTTRDQAFSMTCCLSRISVRRGPLPRIPSLMEEGPEPDEHQAVGDEDEQTVFRIVYI